MRQVLMLLLLAILTLGPTAKAQGEAQQVSAQVDVRAIAVIEKFLSTFENVQTLSFRLHKVERLRNGKTINEEAFVKFKKPGLLYLAALKPKEGQEVIYNPLVDKAQLVAHRGSFPDITVNISIYGRLALDNQHHPVTHTGFAYTAGILRRALEQGQKAHAGERLQHLGHVTFNGRRAQKVVLTGGQAPQRLVQAQKGESLFAFARRVDMDAHVIYMANADIGALHSTLSAGKHYAVPPYYAQRTELLFDEQTSMPIRQAMYDAEGKLYELYEYYDLLINPPLGDKDFDPKNPDYGF